MLAKLKTLFCAQCFPWAAGPSCDPTKHPYATATTPDQLIVAAIHESFFKNFDDWTVESTLPTDIGSAYRFVSEKKNKYWNEKGYSWRNLATTTLKNSKMQVVVNLKFISCKQYNREGPDRYFYTLDYAQIQAFTDTFINLDRPASQRLMKAWEEVYAVNTEAKRIADQAKREMEANEAKWNVAEKLLNMKRLPNGALVAVTDPETGKERIDD